MNGLSLSHLVCGSAAQKRNKAHILKVTKASYSFFLVDYVYNTALGAGSCESLEPFGSLSEARAGVPSHHVLASSDRAPIMVLTEQGIWDTCMKTFLAYFYALYELLATRMQHQCCL